MKPWRLNSMILGVGQFIESDPQSWEQRGNFWSLFMKGNINFGLEVTGPFRVVVRSRSHQHLWQLSLREQVYLYLAILEWKLFQKQSQEEDEDGAWEDTFKWIARMAACGYTTEQCWLDRNVSYPGVTLPTRLILTGE